jgi:hypothetical protein
LTDKDDCVTLSVLSTTGKGLKLRTNWGVLELALSLSSPVKTVLIVNEYPFCFDAGKLT